MRARVISAVVGLGILGVVLYYFETPVFVFTIAILSALAVFELVYSTKILEDKLTLVLVIAFSFCMPLFFSQMLRTKIFFISFLYIALACTLFIIKNASIKFTSFATSIALSLIIPAIFSLLIKMRDMHGGFAIFFLALSFIGAWVSDTGAFFAGKYFGKRKLAPNISPNKTVEGFIGGILSAVLGYFLISVLFNKFFIPAFYADLNIEINVLYVVLIAPFCAASGVCGDLFASIIKRQSGIKDYGSIMPGHGGVMDRFDSLLFVIPAVFVLSFIVPLFKIV